MNTVHTGTLKAFGTKVQSEATRDLQLLRDIEETLGALDERAELVRKANAAADYYIGLLNRSNLEFPDDVDLLPLFESARDAVERAYEKWSLKHVCAANAPELQEDDGVVDGYAVLLMEVASLHEKLNSLCWIIRELEADQDKTLPGQFTDADDLFAAMGV